MVNKSMKTRKEYNGKEYRIDDYEGAKRNFQQENEGKGLKNEKLINKADKEDMIHLLKSKNLDSITAMLYLTID